MLNTLEWLVSVWRRRYWQPDAGALAFTAGLTPFVLVTGATSGIGRATAERFAMNGHALFLVARSEADLTATGNDLATRHGVVVASAALDLSAPDAGARLEEAVAAHGGYVDILVNNAATGLAGPFAGQDPAAIDALADLNVRAPAALMRRFLPGMVARGRGGVLNIGSLGGQVPGPHQAAYYASKAYLQSLTEAVAEELTGQGVRISIMVPGPVATSFHRKMGAEGSAYLHLIPVMSAEQVARSAHFWFRLGRTTIVPGLLHHVSIVLLRFIPRSVILPILSRMLRK